MSNPASSNPANPPTSNVTQETTAPQPISESRFAKLKRWFAPRSCDLIVMFGCFAAILAFLFPIAMTSAIATKPSENLNSVLPITLCLVASCLAATASLLALGRLNRSMVVWISGFCILGVIFYYIGIANNRQTASAFFFTEGMPKDSRYWLFTGLPVLWVVSGLAGIFAIYWLSVFALSKAVSFFGKSTEGVSESKLFRPTRIQMMIGIAVTLFLAAQIQNLFFPQGFSAGFSAPGGASTSVVVGVLLGLLGFLALQMFPVWLLTRKVGEGFRWCLVAGLLVLAVLLHFARSVSDPHISTVEELNALNALASFCVLSVR